MGVATVEFRGDEVLTPGGRLGRVSRKNSGQVPADGIFHVVALDARGHGDGERAPNVEYYLPTLVGDAAAVVHQISRPVALIGASMGGMTGIMLAGHLGPQSAGKLVLVDVVPRFGRWSGRPST